MKLQVVSQYIFSARRTRTFEGNVYKKQAVIYQRRLSVENVVSFVAEYRKLLDGGMSELGYGVESAADFF
jgi:hypothetical protein